MAEEQAHRRRIAQLEADLLARLSQAQGDLLDDTALINVLAVAKRTAAEAGVRLAVARRSGKRLRAAKRVHFVEAKPEFAKQWPRARGGGGRFLGSPRISVCGSEAKGRQAPAVRLGGRLGAAERK